MNLLAFLMRPLERWRCGGAINGGDVRRILVVELWNIGDVVLTMPFLAQLRRLFPNGTTTLLARPHAAELLSGTGLVDEFIPVDLAWDEKSARVGPSRPKWVQLLQIARKLRGREFDLAFHSRLHVRERALVAVSGAGRRVGYSFGGYDRGLTDAIEIEEIGRQKVVDWMRLLAPFGGPVELDPPQLFVSDAERTWAAEYLAAHGFAASDVVIGIHPGASVREKRWPIDSFRKVAAALAGRSGTRILAFVDPVGYGSQIGEVPGVTTAQVGLRQLIALIQRCALLACNDSGPMHIAGALGVPTVSIFSSRVSEWFAPLGGGHEFIVPTPEQDGSANHGPSAPPYDVSMIPPAIVLEGIDRALRRIAVGAQAPSTG